MTKQPFGLAEPKKEGGKLWPMDYLIFNDKRPPKSYYTAEELADQKHRGYTEDYYDNEAPSNS